MVRGAPRQIFEKQRLSGERSLPNSNCQGMSWSDPVRTHRGCGSEGKSCPKLELARGVDVYLDGAVWLVPGRRRSCEGGIPYCAQFVTLYAETSKRRFLLSPIGNVLYRERSRSRAPRVRTLAR